MRFPCSLALMLSASTCPRHPAQGCSRPSGSRPSASGTRHPLSSRTAGSLSPLSEPPPFPSRKQLLARIGLRRRWKPHLCTWRRSLHCSSPPIAPSLGASCQSTVRGLVVPKLIEISFLARGGDDLLVDAGPFVAVQHGSILGRNFCISPYRLVDRGAWHVCRWFLGRAPGMAARHRHGG